MRCCVTGSGGFLGSYIQNGLIEQGHEVLSIDNLSGGFKRNLNPKAQIAIIDLCNKEAVEWELKKFEPEIIYHCAANAREGASFFDPAKIVMANQVATINLLEAAIKVGSLHKWIGFSSMSIYGEQEPPFDESLLPKPVDPYGWAKYSMEEVTKELAACHGFKYTILRPHNILGPRQSIRDIYRNVAGIFMNRIMRKEPIYIYGDGQQKRAFSYIEDSLPAYLACIDKADNETINIGGIYEITVEHLAFMVIDKMKSTEYLGTHPIIYLPARYGEVKYAYCTYQKSIDLLGYNEEYGIEQGIEKMSAWAKQLGPVPWIEEPLAIPNHYAPITWTNGGKK